MIPRRRTPRYAAALLTLAGLSACERDAPTSPSGRAPGAAAAPAPAPPGSPAPGVRAPRRVAVEAGAGGYAPSTIEASPGEALLLVFTRTSPGECLAQVRVGDGAPVDLPLGQPVEIAVTAPASGQLGFACGMDMATGTVVVQ